MTSSVTDNTAQNRFELAEKGETAYANYRRENRTLYIDYVFSPPALRGTGAAGRLMQGIVERARGESLPHNPARPRAHDDCGGAWR